MEEKLRKFWSIYDKYIKTGDRTLRKDLSELLAQVEQKGRENQLFRPEKGWTRILAWQVLRSQDFYYRDSQYSLHEGEILAWTPCWDRDVYLTRIPYNEMISGYFLRPGYFLETGQKGMSDYEWDEFVKNNIFTDERGLYLPLYEFETIKEIAFEQIDSAKEKIVSFLKEKIANRNM